MITGLKQVEDGLAYEDGERSMRGTRPGSLFAPGAGRKASLIASRGFAALLSLRDRIDLMTAPGDA